jgi:CheY-like chemotaxis protein
MTAPASILIVDDQRDAREMLAEYLAFCGFVVHKARDGVEAIAMALRLYPRVILMDLMMPRMDGWEATRRLKSDARTRDIPIIAVSANSHVEDQQMARQAGCDAFVPKPCDLAHLSEIVRDAIESTTRLLTPRRPRRADPNDA